MTSCAERLEGTVDSQTAGNSGLPGDQGVRSNSITAAGVDLAGREARLPDPRRHSDHAAGEGEEDGVAMRARRLIGALAILAFAARWPAPPARKPEFARQYRTPC